MKLPNLKISGEGDWIVLLEREGGGMERVQIYRRNKWKRITAIAHGRHLALRYPTRRVMVMPDSD